MGDSKRTVAVLLPRPSLRDDMLTRHVWLRWVALTIIVIAAGWLRLGGITQVGIRLNDEAAYAADARLWHRSAKTLTDGAALKAISSGDKVARKARLVEIGVDFDDRYLKPCQGYTFLAAAAMFLVGDNPSALCVTNAVFGTLSVVLLYLLGVELFGPIVGLCAALLLALSPYHLLYCRSGLTQATGTFFVLLGVLSWVAAHAGRSSWQRAYFLSGLSLGYAAICHYTLAYFAGALVLTDVIVAGAIGRRPEEWARRWGPAERRWLYLTMGAVTPAIAVEAVLRGARALAAGANMELPVPTLLEGWQHWSGLLNGRLGVPGGGLLNPETLSAYANYLVHWHGTLATLLGVVGLLTLFFSPRAAKAPAVILLSTMGLLLCQRFVLARSVGPIVPFFLLSTAVAVATVLSMVLRRRPRLATAAIVLLSSALAWPSFEGSRRLYDQRSQLGEVCAYLEEQRAQAVAVPNGRPYRLYLDATAMKVIGLDELGVDMPPAKRLAQLRRRGVRYIVSDPQRWHYGSRSRTFRWWERMQLELDRSATLVVTFPHIRDALWEYLVEGPGEALLSEMILHGGGAIRVYDISFAGSADASAPECSGEARISC